MKELLAKVRRLNIALVCLLVLQLMLCPKNTLGSEHAVITIEQAEQTVREYFSIPDNYSNLSSEFNQYMDRTTYSLNWNSVEEPGGSFHAEVDAVSGEILSVSQWEYPSSPSFKLPVLTEKDAEKIAVELTSKLVSNHLAELKLVKDKQRFLAINNSQPLMYNFRWVRIVNGIPFPGNGVTVSVSGEDGKIINYNYDWMQGLVFPTPINILSPEKAQQVFTDTPMLELQYFIPPITDPKALEPQRVLLVYQLSNKYYDGAVDALSGRPVTLEPQAVAFTPMSAAESSFLESASPDNESLKSRDSLENSRQISQEEAVEIVQKLIVIPKHFVLKNSSLTPDWQNPNEQVWELNWNSESLAMEEGYLNVRVNAKTGDLVGLNLYTGVKPDNKSEPLTRKEAKKLADDFLKHIQPKQFELVEVEAQSVSESYYGGIVPENIQLFTYARYVNGLPVLQNGMNVTVDTVAKQVNNYNMYWSNLEFPSASKVLSPQEIAEQFLKIRPLELNYSLMFLRNGQLTVRLVYQPKIDYSMAAPAMLNAETGDPLDWAGNTQSPWAGSYGFTDIQGNYAEKEIGLLGLAGAFGEYEETFRPDEKITAGSLLRAMLTVEGNNLDSILSEDEVWRLAEEKGWIDEELQPDSEISRENLSKIMIRLIDMEQTAQIKGIYTVPFTDAKTIKDDSLGYIALAWGLGILKPDGNTLHPEQTVTRAEAAYALVHAYNLI